MAICMVSKEFRVGSFCSAVNGSSIKSAPDTATSILSTKGTETNTAASLRRS